VEAHIIMASIRKRSWASGGSPRSAWVVDYVDQAGVRRLKTFARRKDADDALTKIRHEVSQGTHTAESASITVAAAATLWLEHGEAIGLEAGTLRTNELTLRYHVLPLLGRERLARLTAPRVQRFVDALLAGADGRARSHDMARRALKALKAVLGEAHQRGLVAQNVATPIRLRLSQRHRERIVIPPKEHVRALLDAAAPRWRPLLVAAAFTGLRASELRGLRWGDVDLKAGVLTVHQRADRFRAIGSPKSAAARRDVPLMPIVVNTLREWRLACPRGDLDLVFPTAGGRVHSHGNVVELGFMAAQRRAGLVDAAGKPLYHFHLLRHFACSLFIDAGFAPKRVQAIMGHSSITMTFDHYGHLFPSPEDDAKRLLAAQLAVMLGAPGS
jgi:integrase